MLPGEHFFLSLFFLLGACERMKRMKEKRQKGTFEKSLKVLSSKSCNFWLGWGRLSLLRDTRCFVHFEPQLCAQQHKSFANAAQTDPAPRGMLGKPLPDG